MNPMQLQLDDQRRGEFLRAIDTDVETLSNFELSFIETFREQRGKIAGGLDHHWFTEARRDVVDKMIQRYGMRSHKFETAPSAFRLPTAEQGKCGYIIRDENRQQVRCGKSASVTLHNGLELCKDCNDTREAALKRARDAKQERRRF